ncbi:unnamed protein product [Merluccius merluccius]
MLASAIETFQGEGLWLLASRASWLAVVVVMLEEAEAAALVVVVEEEEAAAAAAEEVQHHGQRRLLRGNSPPVELECWSGVRRSRRCPPSYLNT